nr:putative motility protein [Jejubacter calystegiae]
MVITGSSIYRLSLLFTTKKLLWTSLILIPCRPRQIRCSYAAGIGNTVLKKAINSQSGTALTLLESEPVLPSNPAINRNINVTD